MGSPEPCGAAAKREAVGPGEPASPGPPSRLGSLSALLSGPAPPHGWSPAPVPPPLRASLDPQARLGSISVPPVGSQARGSFSAAGCSGLARAGCLPFPGSFLSALPLRLGGALEETSSVSKGSWEERRSGDPLGSPQPLAVPAAGERARGQPGSGVVSSTACTRFTDEYQLFEELGK